MTKYISEMKKIYVFIPDEGKTVKPFPGVTNENIFINTLAILEFLYHHERLLLLLSDSPVPWI